MFLGAVEKPQAPPALAQLGKLTGDASYYDDAVKQVEQFSKRMFNEQKGIYMHGWVQGMGFPPCCRVMTHWFPPRRLATVMSVWNISHSIGAGATWFEVEHHPVNAWVDAMPEVREDLATVYINAARWCLTRRKLDLAALKKEEFEAKAAEVIAKLKARASLFRIVGSYPKAIL